MTRKLVRAGLFAAALVGFALTAGVTVADDKKVPTIKEIMKKGHAGTKSIMAGVEKEAKAGKWDDAGKGATLLKEFGEGLGKNKPPKGDDDSWKKLSDKYKETTSDLASAVEKKDAAKVGEEIGLLKKSCMECHSAHKK